MTPDQPPQARSAGRPKGTGRALSSPHRDYAFAAFVALGASRKLPALQKALEAETPPIKVALKTLKRWSAKDAWIAKAEAEDRRIASLKAEAVAAKAVETVAEAAGRLGISHGYILKNLKDVAERCLQAEPVLDPEGNPTGEYRFDAKGAVAALKLMGETVGTFQATPPPNQGGTTINGNVIVGAGAEIAAEIRALMREYDPLALPPTIDATPTKPD